MKINLKWLILVSVLQIGPVNASIGASSVIGIEDIFEIFNKDIELECYKIGTSKSFSKNDVIFILKNCKPYYISNMLIKLNKNLFIEHIKTLKIDQLGVDRKTTNLNTALLNIYKLKRPHVELTNNDYDILWNSSGLYLYYAYILATNNTNTTKIIDFLKRKANSENLPFGEHFFYLTGPAIVILYNNKFTNYKRISEFLTKELNDVPLELLPCFYRQINFNSKELRDFEFKRLQKMTKFMDRPDYNNSNTFRMAHKYFNRLVHLSYLAKDKEMIKKIYIKKNYVFFHKSSFFLIEKSNQNIYLEPYIFFYQNSCFRRYEHVPYHIEDYRIL